MGSEDRQRNGKPGVDVMPDGSSVMDRSPIKVPPGEHGRKKVSRGVSRAGEEGNENEETRVRAGFAQEQPKKGEERRGDQVR